MVYLKYGGLYAQDIFINDNISHQIFSVKLKFSGFVKYQKSMLNA